VLATADGAEFRSIDRWADRAPSWSPGGEWLVYQAPGGLRIVDAAGDTPTEIDLRGATASQPDWSPR
jgi:Tol biopolymer transport system component